MGGGAGAHRPSLPSRAVLTACTGMKMGRQSAKTIFVVISLSMTHIPKWLGCCAGQFEVYLLGYPYPLPSTQVNSPAGRIKPLALGAHSRPRSCKGSANVPLRP